MDRKLAERTIALVLALLLGLVATAIVANTLGLWPTSEAPVARSYEDLVWLRKEAVSLTATGAAGAATGSASTDRDLHGYIYAVHLDFTAGISSTTDITLTQANPALTVLQLSDYYTDTWYYPAVQQHTSAGAGTSTYERVLVADAVDISAGQTTSGTVATVTIYWGQ